MGQRKTLINVNKLFMNILGIEETTCLRNFKKYKIVAKVFFFEFVT